MSRGQILERMTVVSAGDVELEALWQPGIGGASDGAREGAAMPVVVAGPHPRIGGNMDAPACAEVVWHLARRGHPTLRFNWRGMGASTGTSRVPSSIDDEIADLERAIAQHAGGSPCAVVGISFGCGPAAVVAARHPLVERAVLVAPLFFGALAAADARAVRLDALAASGVPVGVIAGGDDAQAPAAEVERVIAGRFRLDVIAGANHGFTAGLVELGRKVAQLLPGLDREPDR